MKQHMSCLFLNVATTIGKYPLMYSLLIQHCGMILKLALTTITEVVDWGKAKQHTILEGVHVDFLKQDLNEPRTGFGILIMLRLIKLNPL